MRTLLKATFVAALALAAQARAEVFTYEYTSVITKVEQYVRNSNGSLIGGDVGTSDWPGFVVAAGEKVRGRFSYDTESQESVAGEYCCGYYTTLYVGAQNALALTFENSGYAYRSSNDLPVELATSTYPAGGGSDAFGVWQWDYDGANRRLVSITMLDDTGTALPYRPDRMIPDSLAGFARGEFDYEIYSPDFSKMVFVSGALTSVRQVSPVPEPGTYAMLLAGLGLVGWQRKRTSRAQ